MQWLTKLFTGNLGEIGLQIRQAIKGKEVDPDKLTELLKLQSEVNKVEASSRNLFIAGWRPFIGWVCGFALLYNYVLRDIIIFFNRELADMPALQMEELLTILMGMLGLGGLRTFEKMKNKTQ